MESVNFPLVMIQGTSLLILAFWPHIERGYKRFSKILENRLYRKAYGRQQ